MISRMVSLKKCYSQFWFIHKKILLVFGKNECEYTIEFNKYTRKSKADKLKEIKNEEDEGPVVERKCPQCGNNKMSYATLQLRSADEGQTVFFTCTKCK